MHRWPLDAVEQFGDQLRVRRVHFAEAPAYRALTDDLRRAA